jgi:hypothetical protein
MPVPARECGPPSLLTEAGAIDKFRCRVDIPFMADTFPMVANCSGTYIQNRRNFFRRLPLTDQIEYLPLSSTQPASITQQCAILFVNLLKMLSLLVHPVLPVLCELPCLEAVSPLPQFFISSADEQFSFQGMETYEGSLESATVALRFAIVG